jgi:thioredoxin reductase (NADPH)
MTDTTHDCLVIGGGPAGLTAAIYLARYHLDVIVVDDGRSRAATIPLSRNYAGFPEGITGVELINRMRVQAEQFGAKIGKATVVKLEKSEGTFSITTDAGVNRVSRTVLLATGVFNRRPKMPEALHDEGVARSLLRYCPICDAYEITDQKVAVIGTGDRGVNEAVFLRSFTHDVTLISHENEHELTEQHAVELQQSGIGINNGPFEIVRFVDSGIVVRTAAAETIFAAVYPALGSDIRSELAASLAAERTKEGCVVVDRHQRTSVEGLYAAGDVVIGLDQVSHAVGQAGVAATAIRNDLTKGRALLR